MKFKIKKGKHYHSNVWARISKLFAFGLDEGVFTIPANAWYDKYNTDANDFNKLCGISGFIHKNSARLVWRPNFEDKGFFDVHAYIYYKGKRWPSIFLGTIKGDIPIHYRVEKNKGGYSFKSKTNPVWNRSIKVDKPQGLFRAFPFFGGDNSAPNDIVININYKKSVMKKWFKKYGVVIWTVLIVGIAVCAILYFAIFKQGYSY